MPYRHLNRESITDPKKADIFRRADLYLRDVYAMLRLLPPKDGDGGGGNFGAALILLCIIDGLARSKWPHEDQDKRFKKLIRERLPWGPEGKGMWLEKGNAAKQLYVQFRNPLVHQLSEDSATSPLLSEPVVGKWGDIPKERWDIGAIEALTDWPRGWPVLTERIGENGSPQLKLSVVAFYWAVKRLTESIIEEAVP